MRTIQHPGIVEVTPIVCALSLVLCGLQRTNHSLSKVRVKSTALSPVAKLAGFLSPERGLKSHLAQPNTRCRLPCRE